MTRTTPPKGFRDIVPQEKRRREQLLSRIRAAYRAHGFDEIETPVAEMIENLRGSEGGENLALIFEIMKRNVPAEVVREAADAGELVDMGLRYDLTVPLARFYAANQEQLPAIAKTIQIAPVWRAERPQKGRYRQFMQCDIDIIGDATHLAEIELVLATLDALEGLGLDGCRVRINDRRLLDAMMDRCGVPPESRPKALIEVDKLDKMPLDKIGERLQGFLPDATATALVALVKDALELPATVAVAEATRSLGLDVDDAVVGALDEVLDEVRQIHGSEAIRLDPTLVRGMGYYTGAIFEVEHPSSAHSVGGGGRYDGMVERFSGRPTPACGFSLGFERLVDLVDVADETDRPRAAIIVRKRDLLRDVLARQRRLIEGGHDVRIVPEAKNKARMFDELVASGIDRWQHVTDDEDDFRSLKTG